MLRLPRGVVAQMEQEARSGYPYEVCGLLLGQTSPQRAVVEAHPVPNLNREQPRVRYDLDPAVYLRLQRLARTRGLEIVGVYHSHPDHPPRPSEFDRSRAWPGLSYIVIGVQGGTQVEITSSQLLEDTERFQDEGWGYSD